MCLVANDPGNVIGVNSYDEYGIPAAGNIGRFQYIFTNRNRRWVILLPEDARRTLAQRFNVDEHEHERGARDPWSPLS